MTQSLSDPLLSSLLLVLLSCFTFFNTFFSLAPRLSCSLSDKSASFLTSYSALMSSCSLSLEEVDLRDFPSRFSFTDPLPFSFPLLAIGLLSRDRLGELLLCFSVDLPRKIPLLLLGGDLSGEGRRPLTGDLR